MQSIEGILCDVFRTAIARTWPSVSLPKILVVPGKDPAIGEFQCNNALGLPKLLKSANVANAPANPLDVAQELIKNLPSNDVICGTTVEKGFINIKISKSYVAQKLYDILKHGLKPPPMKRQRVLIDFSSPNIAKEMHVGHLRSTIIGEFIARLFEFCGHDVARINHVGDWGTQFGMLIAYLKEQFPDFKAKPPPISDLVAFYKASKKKFDSDEDFKKRAYQEVVSLQGGNDECLTAWRQICEVSRVEFSKIYERLHVTLVERGESFYNPMLPPLVEELARRGLAYRSEGAMIVVSGDLKPAGAVTKADVEKLLSFYFLKTVLSENEPFVAILRNLGLVKDNAEGKACLVVALGKKEELLPLSGISTTKLDSSALGKITKLLASKLHLQAAGDGGKPTKPKDSASSPSSAAKGTLNPEFLELLQKIPHASSGSGGSSGSGAGGSEPVVRIPKFTFPYMVQKSDGGFTYDTTDLAALRHRLESEKFDRVVYVTDLGQELHFQMLFAAAVDAGFLDSSRHRVDHVGFGLVCGVDGKKLKTREGETIRLVDLLDKAVSMSFEESKAREEARVKEKGPAYVPISEQEMRENAKVIGYGAIKYFDLRQNRTTDYKFSYEAMLDLEGNTAVHLIYAYVRMRSIARNANVAHTADVLAELEAAAPQPLTVYLGSDAAWALALHLMRFSFTIESIMDDLYPNKMTDFLYSLVTKFNDFYAKDRVIGVPDQNQKLLLCEVTAKVLKEGLRLLGIDVLEKI